MRKYLIITILTLFKGGALLGMQGAIFPFCAQSGSLESSRLNNFHIFFDKLNGKMGFKNFILKTFDRKMADCDIVKKRNLALVSNSEQFLSTTYNIVGDSLSLQYLMLYSKILDKEVSKNTFKGKLSETNELLKKMLSKIFTDFDLHPNPQQWQTVFTELKADEGNYNNGDATGSSQDFFGLGKLAFDANNYELALKNFEQVQTSEKNYAEAMYLAGKAYLFYDNFNGALDCFVRSKSKQGNFSDLNLYIESSKILVKPNVWYDNIDKRKNWWNKLNNTELNAMLTLMNSLKINGKSFDNSYQFEDADIKQLFLIKTLVCKGMKLENFKCFTSFSSVDVLILENTKFSSTDGLEKLKSLKVIRTNIAGLEKGSLKDFIKSQKIAIIAVQ